MACGRAISLLMVALALTVAVEATAAPIRGRGAGGTADGHRVAGIVMTPGFGGQAQPAQEEFVPIDELPPEDQLPAAPLLVAAYAVAWVALLGYLWSIWRRLTRVEQELADVARKVAERARGV